MLRLLKNCVLSERWFSIAKEIIRVKSAGLKGIVSWFRLRAFPTDDVSRDTMCLLQLRVMLKLRVKAAQDEILYKTPWLIVYI